ncbi:TVP38/TMEM64 family protein [Brevundimonas naejangsanensis]|uniref:TVP38/TMEM64 family membrane protein n=1 Tax=Brevundimonas naejangsanensis TaxID=588932 RepID=A0A494RDC1_9CAUL|nr:TVP38/TMEM64 family protein [Brevundimonas naejangsanensis]
MDRVKRFLPLAVLATMIVLIFGMGWNRYLSLDTLRVHGAAFQTLTEQHYALMLLALMLIFALLTASVVPGVVFVTVTAGYLFGPWVGGAATAFAATIGALAVYYVGRTALGDSLRRRAAADTGLLNKVCAGVDRNTFWYVLVARLVVTVPFHMINVAGGVMAAPLRPYMIATFLGLLPAHVIYCWIGDSLHDVLVTNPNPDIRSLFAEFFWPLMGVAFLSMLLPLLLKLAQRLIDGRRARPRQEAP